uniref:Uncharacterized protein n=1 Tax=Arion vulgaris TaxID=1028688 RepID=A0A0B6Y095_9EUPU
MQSLVSGWNNSNGDNLLFLKLKEFHGDNQSDYTIYNQQDTGTFSMHTLHHPLKQINH